MQDVLGQRPAVNLPEIEPHLTKQPSEEGTVTLSTRTAKAAVKRSLSDSTTDHGTVVLIYIYL